MKNTDWFRYSVSDPEDGWLEARAKREQLVTTNTSGTSSLKEVKEGKTVEIAETNTALRYDNDKLRFDLIPTEAMIELAKVYTKGAQKYAPNNWRKGMDYSRCVGSLKRHLAKWEMGHQLDPETECHHLMQVAWNAITLYIYETQGLGTDDRTIPKNLTIDDKMNWIKK